MKVFRSADGDKACTDPRRPETISPDHLPLLVAAALLRAEKIHSYTRNKQNNNNDTARAAVPRDSYVIRSAQRGKGIARSLMTSPTDSW